MFKIAKQNLQSWLLLGHNGIRSLYFYVSRFLFDLYDFGKAYFYHSFNSYTAHYCQILDMT